MPETEAPPSLTIVCSAEWGIASPGVPEKQGGRERLPQVLSYLRVPTSADHLWPPAAIIFQHNAPHNLTEKP